MKSSKKDVHEIWTHPYSALWVTLCPGRTPGRHTVLKRTGQIGREIWEFNSLLVSSAHGQVYIEAYFLDISTKPDKSIRKDSSSPRKASYKYRCILRRFRRNSMCAGKGIVNNSYQSAGLSSMVGQSKGHKPPSGLARHCHHWALISLSRSRWLDVDVALLKTDTCHLGHLILDLLEANLPAYPCAPTVWHMKWDVVVLWFSGKGSQGRSQKALVPLQSLNGCWSFI